MPRFRNTQKSSDARQCVDKLSCLRILLGWNHKLVHQSLDGQTAGSCHKLENEISRSKWEVTLTKYVFNWNLSSFSFRLSRSAPSHEIYKGRVSR